MITLTDRDILELLRTNNLRRNTLEEYVVSALDALHWKVATAESCTGGLVSERITRVSGSSRVFDCGVCSYANAIKAKVLGVSEETLSTLGAVSAETAVQMAQGVKKLSGADIGVSTTGIAGPGGGTAEKPVGLVYMGVCTEEKAYAIRLMLGGVNNDNDRAAIRQFSSDAALFTVLSECRSLHTS